MTDKMIRTIVAPLSDGHLVLPNGAVAEIMNYARPEPFKKAPPWLLGELAWHGWQVPIISFEQLVSEGSGSTINSKARILVIKTLGESTQVNYIGLLIQGLPKLRKVTADSLLEKENDQLPDAVFSEVSIDGLEAVIPELAILTRTVEQAAYGT